MPRFFACTEEIVVFLASVVPKFSIPSTDGANDITALATSIRTNFMQKFGWTADDSYSFAFFVLNLQRVLLLSQASSTPTLEQE